VTDEHPSTPAREWSAVTQIGPERLNAFSDGVIAVVITLMALDLRAPAGVDFTALNHRFPALAVYVLSFVFIGIYWNNHHHLLHRAESISTTVMWTNLHLLLWLSLIPVVTEWVGGAYRSRLPAAVYGVICLGTAGSFLLLSRAIADANGPDSPVATALRRPAKQRASMFLYVAGVALSLVSPYLSYAAYAAVAAIWFVPDRRLMRA
jgi:uncharacterized membrane protein